MNELIMNVPMQAVVTDEQEDYSERLLHASVLIVGAVQDVDAETNRADHDRAVQEAIDQALILEAPEGVDPFQALVTILAAQINQDTTSMERLAWMAGDAPLNGTVPAYLRSEELDAQLDAILHPDPVPSIAKVVRGEVSILDIPLSHRLLAVEYLNRKGKTAREMSRILRCSNNTISRYIARLAKTTEEEAA